MLEECARLAFIYKQAARGSDWSVRTSELAGSRMEEECVRAGFGKGVSAG